MNRPLAILVHGMGRTPVSMALLAFRLRAAGLDTASFGYVAAFEKFSPCVERLRRFIDGRAGDRPCVLIGHSLGTVLLRTALSELAQPPVGCFFIGPPTRACHLARRFASFLPYRLITGEMGQLLAAETFLQGVPIPHCPAYIYAGTGGPRWRFYPVGDEPNDGILKVSETLLAGVPHILVDAQHTFLMNSRALVRDLTDKARAMVSPDQGPAAFPPEAVIGKGRALCLPEDSMHKSKLAGFIVDCQSDDLGAAAKFWGGALGMAVQSLPGAEGEKYIRLIDPNEALHVEVQKVSHPSRVHLDIETDDIEAEVVRLERLGARRVQQVHTWWVMEAPTGHRFCVVSAEGSRDFASRATSWTRGVES